MRINEDFDEPFNKENTKAFPSRKRIGLTGGIATGKSTIATLFAKLGADIIDADVIAKHLLDKNHPNFEIVAEHFGPTIINATGNLNRTKLRDIISNSPAENQWLKDLLHPQVYQTMMNLSNQSKAPYCILMIPLLAESTYDYQLDRICVIDTSPNIQIQRLMQRDNLTEQQANNFINLQIDPQQRLAIADDIIQNNDDIENLFKQVKQLHQHYTMGPTLE